MVVFTPESIIKLNGVEPFMLMGIIIKLLIVLNGIIAFLPLFESKKVSFRITWQKLK